MKLNLGCGTHRLPGFVGIDRYPCRGADVLCDLTASLPFRDGSIDAIEMDNFVEHILDIAALMREVVRVGRDGAMVQVTTPHFSALSSWRDPTHMHHLSYFSMDHFEKPAVAHYTAAGLKVVERCLVFSRSLPGVVGRLLFRISPEMYEKHFCFIFRARTLSFALRVCKPAGADGRSPACDRDA